MNVSVGSSEELLKVLRFLISSVLSYGVVVGASVLKLPQVLAIIRHGNANGVSLSGNLVELLAYVISLSWGLNQRLDFRDFGENAIIFLQLLMLVALVAYHQKAKARTAGGASNFDESSQQIYWAAIVSYLLFGYGWGRSASVDNNVECPVEKGKAVLLTQYCVAVSLNVIIIAQILLGNYTLTKGEISSIFLEVINELLTYFVYFLCLINYGIVFIWYHSVPTMSFSRNAEVEKNLTCTANEESEFSLPSKPRDNAQETTSGTNSFSKETVRKLSDLTRRPAMNASPYNPSTGNGESSINEFVLPGRLFPGRHGIGINPALSSETSVVSMGSSDAVQKGIPSPHVSRSPLRDDVFYADILLSPDKGSSVQLQCVESFQSCGILAHQIDEILRRSTVATSYLQQSLRSALRRQLTQELAFKRILPKLWAMHHILVETESVKGGELASKLQQFIQQGSHRLTSLLSDIYIEAINPLLHMTVSSITKGEVSDPFNEFFITSNTKIEESSDSYWTSKYSLSVNMLPQSVISRDIAEDILLVTKNISFIKQCCRSKQWRMHPSILLEASRASFDTITSVVHHSLAYTNAAVLHLIREEFRVGEVFKMINAFLLVGYGDFMNQYIQVSLVREQVESALLEVAPYAKHLDTDFFSSLHCEVVKDEVKLAGMLFFDDAPRVKVAEVSLKMLGDKALHWIAEVAADAHLLGLQLNHFVMNLWSYLVSEVSTVAWDLLEKAIGRCKSFDDFRVAHNTYLAYLTQRSLLHNDCATIRISIENVLTIVREYRGSQALLTSLLERGCGELASIKRQYQSLTDEFHRAMSSLLTTLEEQHIQYDYLNFLQLIKCYTATECFASSDSCACPLVVQSIFSFNAQRHKLWQLRSINLLQNCSTLLNGLSYFFAVLLLLPKRLLSGGGRALAHHTSGVYERWIKPTGESPLPVPKELQRFIGIDALYTPGGFKYADEVKRSFRDPARKPNLKLAFDTLSRLRMHKKNLEERLPLIEKSCTSSVFHPFAIGVSFPLALPGGIGATNLILHNTDDDILTEGTVLLAHPLSSAHVDRRVMMITERSPVATSAVVLDLKFTYPLSRGTQCSQRFWGHAVYDGGFSQI
eukprot:gene4560-3316_t